jgi:hypothetical protein
VTSSEADGVGFRGMRPRARRVRGPLWMKAQHQRRFGRWSPPMRPFPTPTQIADLVAARPVGQRHPARTEEPMDSAYISALAALAGSSIGAFATFATTWLSQSYQNRIQRHLNERLRRETLFGEFINEAARTYTDSLVNNLENPTLLVNLYAIKSKISLFAEEEILNESDSVVQVILNRYSQKNIGYSEIDPQFDLLRGFTRLCRKEMMKY